MRKAYRPSAHLRRPADDFSMLPPSPKATRRVRLLFADYEDTSPEQT